MAHPRRLVTKPTLLKRVRPTFRVGSYRLVAPRKLVALLDADR